MADLTVTQTQRQAVDHLRFMLRQAMVDRYAHIPSSVRHALYALDDVLDTAVPNEGLMFSWMRYLDFTEREREVALLTVAGMTRAETADFLYLSEQTVQNIVSRIYDKCRVEEDEASSIALLRVLHGLPAKVGCRDGAMQGQE